MLKKKPIKEKLLVEKRLPQILLAPLSLSQILLLGLRQVLLKTPPQTPSRRQLLSQVLLVGLPLEKKLLVEKRQILLALAQVLLLEPKRPVLPPQLFQPLSPLLLSLAQLLQHRLLLRLPQLGPLRPRLGLCRPQTLLLKQQVQGDRLQRPEEQKEEAEVRHQEAEAALQDLLLGLQRQLRPHPPRLPCPGRRRRH